MDKKLSNGMFVVAPNTGAHDNLTPGKSYQVYDVSSDGKGFAIRDDDGDEIFGKLKSDKHILKKDWLISRQDVIFHQIAQERIAQFQKWGEQNHPCLVEGLLKYTPQDMTTEYGIPSESFAKHLCDNAFANNVGTFAHILVEELSEAVSAFDIKDRRQELVQAAAVVVAWIEKIDRDLAKSENAINQIINDK